MGNPDFYIYLDEFEKGDTFLLSAAFVPPDKVIDILNDWNKLRREIKEVLLRDYPRAIRHPALQGDKLPEIHAVDLFQSAGYYRKYKHGSKENSHDKYWLQHYDWLEKSLKIISKHDIQCFYQLNLKPSIKKVADSIATMLGKIEIPNKQISEQKFENLINNSYLHTLPKVLIVIENWLRKNNLTGEIICDDHSMSKGFSINTAIDSLRKSGQYKNLSTPQFTSGLDEPLLQVSDVLCYVKGRNSHYLLENSNLDDLMAHAKEPERILLEWEIKYMENLKSEIPITGNELNAHYNYHVSAIMLDIIFQEVIKNKRIQELVKPHFEKTFKLKGD